MHIFAIIFSALPYIALPGSILLCSAFSNPGATPFFTHILSGSLVWSAYIWLTTNLLSLDDRISSVSIIMIWLVYSTFIFIILWRRRRLINLPNPFPLPPFQATLAALIAIVACITFICALVYPPSNWDVLSYHLPRAEQWLQNHTLAPYPTCIPRQIGMPPFNSMIALQSLAIAHDDSFLNLGQWFAYIGSIAAVYAITRQIGGNSAAAWLSAFFMAFLPSAITQASNTESSAIVTFWLLGCAYVFLAWLKSRAWHHLALFGITLGFAILSKGSAYPLGLPFVLVVAWFCLRHPKKLLFQGLLAATLVICINLPHLARVYAAYGSPVGGTETNILYKPTPGTFVVNAFYNFLVHEPWLIAEPERKKFWIGFANIFNVDQNDNTIFPWGGIRRAADYATPQDGYGQNPVQALFLLLPLSAILLRKFRPSGIYLGAVIGAFVTYFLLLTWHPWTGRIHTTLFAFAAPLCGIFMNTWKRPSLRYIVCAVFCWGAIAPLFHAHGKIPYVDNEPLPNATRETKYFHMQPKISEQFTAAVDFLAAQKASCVGLDLVDNAFEYPLWAMLAKRVDAMPRLLHMRPDSNGNLPNPEFIWIQEAGERYPLAAPRILRRENNVYVQAFPTHN